MLSQPLVCELDQVEPGSSDKNRLDSIICILFLYRIFDMGIPMSTIS